MSDKVLRLVENPVTATAALEDAARCGFKTVMVIGYDADDIMTVITSDDILNKDALWMLEQAKTELIRNAG